MAALVCRDVDVDETKPDVSAEPNPFGDQRETRALPSLSQAPPGNLGGTSSYRRVAIGRVSRQEVAETGSDARELRHTLALVLLFADLSALGLSLLLGRYWSEAGPFAGPLAALVLVGCPLLGLCVLGGYRWGSVAYGNNLFSIAVASLGGALVGLVAHKLVLAAYGTTGIAVVTPRSMAWVLGFTAWAVLTRSIAGRLIRRWEAGWAVIAVGDEADRATVAQTLTRSRLADHLATIDPTATDAAYQLDALIAKRVRCVVLPSARTDIDVALRLALVHARLAGVRVLRLPDLVEELEERVPIGAVDTWWMLDIEQLPAAGSGTYLAMKRALDLLLSVPALILLLPVMALTALAVRLTSAGPAFFTQTRDGLHRTAFTIYKFRTMRVDAEAGGARWASTNDPRVTPIGAFLRKSRLDELPQLWNVIRGDMTLVGPRPERPEFNRMLADRIPWYDLRHITKPGLSGWAQVRYPYGASVEDAIAKLEFDVYYVKHASLGFDLRIIARTAAVVLGLRGR